MVVFSFVATGVTLFWFCRCSGGRYTPALIGGVHGDVLRVPTLAKTFGLMQLVSLEWVPLFILLWWQLQLVQPTEGSAWPSGTAVTLRSGVLCDYYYFLFCWCWPH